LEKSDKRARMVARRRARNQTRLVQASAAHHARIAPSASTASALSSLFMYDCDRDSPGVVIPRPEVQLVVRFGPSSRNGLDVHAFGARQRVHRKLIRRGQRSVTARLALGAPEAVLGVPASEMAGRIVALEDLWGDVAVRRLCARLGDERDTAAAAAVLESAIAERVASGNGNGNGNGRRPARAQLALVAADRLTSGSVYAVAGELGVSERHLRRVFRETVGVSPKAFARIARFQRALGAARGDARAGWADIAAAAGYYDQAHLIAEFRAIAGVTPRVLVGEMRGAAALGYTLPT
jgi:AraC-like DNA-binding protein